MKTKEEEKTLSMTMRQCVDFLNAANNLRSTGSFDFRCAIASIAMEAKRRVQAFNEGKTHSPDFDSFKSEIALHRENCTVEMEGKKSVDVATYMELCEKAKIKYAKTLSEVDKLQQQANKALENKITIYCDPIPM